MRVDGGGWFLHSLDLKLLEALYEAGDICVCPSPRLPLRCMALPLRFSSSTGHGNPREGSSGPRCPDARSAKQFLPCPEHGLTQHSFTPTTFRSREAELLPTLAVGENGHAGTLYLS